MNKDRSDILENLPTAKLRARKRSFPSVWIVPLVAAVVAGWLVYVRVREFGPTITIRFLDAQGLKPGQTPLQYRGVVVGEVTDVDLSENQQYALVRVNLRRPAAALAQEGSIFWIVRPRLDMGSVTGLGTLVRGPHLTVLPGTGARSSEFTGLDASPATVDPRGLNIVLRSPHGGSLRAGVPIYYRSIQVGAVREARLSAQADTVEIHAVIQQRYAPLVRHESKFWNVTGIDVRFGLFSGAEINVDSLKSLVLGGIAFATPEESLARPVSNGATYPLHEQPDKKWMEWSPKIPIDPAEQPVEEFDPVRPFPSVESTVSERRSKQ